MADLSTATLETVIRSTRLPDSSLTVEDIGQIEALDIDNGVVELTLLLQVPCEPFKQPLGSALWQSLSELDGVTDLNLNLDTLITEHPVADSSKAVANVGNIIAVASGKGGVGKSTTAVNLALALQQLGARVGILDADVYGPSVANMLGTHEERPEVVDQKAMKPLYANGVYSISMANLVTERTPMVWRGPMASGALQQLLRQTQWPPLDYLIIDMPPGTGDIQLTLSQQVPVSGAVIVTTPQDIALLDAKKGIEMFRKVSIPVLGVVENMSTHICSQCGHEEPIFGVGGGDRIAKEFDTRLLGQLPLSLAIREAADSTTPACIVDTDSDIAVAYRDIALAAATELRRQQQQTQVPTIEVVDE